MKLTCPECGATVSAANINIQEMVAVCETCNTLFRFDASAASRKARKVRQPSRLELHDLPAQVALRYRCVPNEGERGLMIGNGFFVVLLTVVFTLALLYHAPMYIPLLIGLWGIIAWYAQVAMLFNRTTISLDADRLAVDVAPLPWLTGASKLAFDREDITDITCEETENSRQSAAIDRFYHVRVRLVDGGKITLLKAMPQDYAFYIAQELNVLLESESDTAASEAGEAVIDRLEDRLNDDDHTDSLDAVAAKSARKSSR